MSTSQFVSVREASQILAISEKKIMVLIEDKKLQAYKIADKFLRLKKSDVLGLRNSGNIVRENVHYTYTVGEKVKDFFYFNDFYLISVIIILAFLYVILYT